MEKNGFGSSATAQGRQGSLGSANAFRLGLFPEVCLSFVGARKLGLFPAFHLSLSLSLSLSSIINRVYV